MLCFFVFLFLFSCLLLISASEPCPQPQTSEHLAAVEIMRLSNILIVQNKIDLVKKEQAQEQHEEILRFIQGTIAEGSPIIPISGKHSLLFFRFCCHIIFLSSFPTSCAEIQH